MEYFLKCSAVYFSEQKHDINSFCFINHFFAEIIAQSEKPVKYAVLTEDKSGHIVKAEQCVGGIVIF